MENTIESTIRKDLNLNFRRVLEEGSLTPVEGHLALLAIAQSLQNPTFIDRATERLKQEGLSAEEIQEAKDSAAMMGMLNTYYRFRHFVTEANPELAETYKNAALRMTVFAKPLLGKARFEMLAFAVSVINGCETCVRSHEVALRQAEIEPAKIHDLARLAAIVKGLTTLG